MNTKITRRESIKRGLMLSAGVASGAGRLFADSAEARNTGGLVAIRPQWDSPVSPINHSWAGLGNNDMLKFVGRKDLLEQLGWAGKEIGLKHLRSVGLFEDSLHVYDKDPLDALTGKKSGDGRRLNWRNANFSYDCLLELGINPYISTTYMPTGIASGDSHVFYRGNGRTPPKDYQQFAAIVKSLAANLTDRYGRSMVRNWYFEIWNEPNLKYFWTGSMQDYFELYRHGYEAIKSVDSEFKVGGPTTARCEQIGEFLEFCRKNDCRPDFISSHCYNDDSADAPMSPFDGDYKDKEKNSPNFLSGVVRGARKLLNEQSFKGEFHLNEWGSSWHPTNVVRDTPNEAAFIVKTMKEVSQEAERFAYWAISDIFDQTGYGREEFIGYFGMISQSGLKKPSYMAHQLLCRLGNENVAVAGENLSDNINALVTRSAKGFQALIYGFDINWQPPMPVTKQSVSFYLPKRADTDRIKVVRLNSTENNLPKLWRDIGSPAYPTREQVLELRNHNAIEYSKDTPKFEKDSTGMKAVFEMELPGVVFMEIPSAV